MGFVVVRGTQCVLGIFSFEQRKLWLWQQLWFCIKSNKSAVNSNICVLLWILRGITMVSETRESTTLLFKSVLVYQEWVMETYSGTRPKVKMEVDECGTVFLCQEIMTNRQGTIRASRSTVCEKPKRTEGCAKSIKKNKTKPGLTTTSVGETKGEKKNSLRCSTKWQKPNYKGDNNHYTTLFRDKNPYMSKV